MRFIDNTGHIFSMQSFTGLPIGYEYEQTPYIFWIDNEYSQKLSVNNYYLLPIRILMKEEITDIHISVNSDVFKLYCPDNNLGENSIELSALLSEITDINKLNQLHELSVDGDSSQYSLYTFYIIANTENEGTWSTNILIHITYNVNLKSGNTVSEDIYCPITVAGTFVDEIEQLQINASNIGVNLPKDIIKAVYQYQYNTDVIDEVAYNTKLKEYLINHMALKSECGNYNAVLRAIDWFGWKDKVDLVKHLKTDNEFIEQFINDSFNIEDDIISAYNNFKTAAYMSLFIKENKETDTQYALDFNNTENDFWGEGKPELEDLFNKTVNVNIDNINFIKQYYDYTFAEMGIKISCMAYMLKKYFLPIHLSIKNASIRHQVFANDTKMLNRTYVVKSSEPVYASIDSYVNKTWVEFDNIDTYFLYKHQNTYIDTNFNIFSNYTKTFCETTNEYTFYDLGQVLSVIVPINFNSNFDNAVYNCTIVLDAKDNTGNITNLYISNFSFAKAQEYNGFAITPALLDEKINIDYWEDNTFIVRVLCNGIWYSKELHIKLPDLQMSFASIRYMYDSDMFRQVKSITGNTPEFICDMYLDDLVTINNAHFVDEFTRAYNLGESSINYYLNELNERIKITNNKKFYNRIHIYDISLINHTSENENLLTYNSEDLSIYKSFFNDNGEQKYWLSGPNGNLNYDFYLMRDASNKYYAVFISRDTINNVSLLTEKITGISTPENNNFRFTKIKTDELFLINRMTLIPDNGEHKFNSEDIVVVNVDNINLPFIFSLGTKWKFKNMSIGSEYVDNVTSKTNMAIMSIPNNQVKYAKGYYDIIVSYTVDNFNNINRTLTQRICII